MRKTFSFFLCCFLFFLSFVKGNDTYFSDKIMHGSSVSSGLIKTSSLPIFSFADSLNTASTDALHPKKHRLVAALLTFPLGVFGLHRMYLGTSAIVPIVYIVTIGGVFGVLPFIDFVLILLSKDIHKTYTGNHHLFMWQKK
jgi:TM2 domain-containing membrane protein YozV